MIDERADGSGDAVAFIAHDDDTVGCVGWRMLGPDGRCGAGRC